MRGGLIPVPPPDLDVITALHHTPEIIARIRAETGAESPLLASRLRPADDPPPGYADILTLAGGEDGGELALGLEYIFEGYLLHYGSSRLLTPERSGFDLLAGDYMYARGLDRVAALDDLFSIRVLAGLISLCAFFHGEKSGGAAPAAWLAAALLLAGGGDEAALASFLQMKSDAWSAGQPGGAPAALAGRLLGELDLKRRAGVEAVQAEMTKRFFPGQE